MPSVRAVVCVYAQIEFAFLNQIIIATLEYARMQVSLDALCYYYLPPYARMQVSFDASLLWTAASPTQCWWRRHRRRWCLRVSFRILRADMYVCAASRCCGRSVLATTVFVYMLLYLAVYTRMSILQFAFPSGTETTAAYSLSYALTKLYIIVVRALRLQHLDLAAAAAAVPVACKCAHDTFPRWSR